MAQDYSAEKLRAFQFFIGVVEDRADPAEQGRVKVRCFGIHTEDKSDIPTKDLPWATPIMPYTSASISGIGTSPTGPVEGTWVVGFFIDGKEMQQPMILGTLVGAPDQKSDKSKGFNDPNGIYPKLYSAHPAIGYLEESDVNRLARGDTIEKNHGGTPFGARAGESTHYVKLKNRTKYVFKATPPDTTSVKDGAPPGEDPVTYFDRGLWSEPQSRYGSVDGSEDIGTHAPYNLRAVRESGEVPTYGGVSKYPLNHVHVTETGHVFEVDDSPKAARIHQYHNSGTFYEIQPNGTRVTKVVGDDYEIVLHDKNVLVSGNVNITVNQSDLRLYVNKNKKSGQGGDVFFECDGDFNLNVKGDMTTKIQGSEHKEVLTDSSTQINGKKSLRVAKDRNETIEGNTYISVTGSRDLQVSGNKSSLIQGTDFSHCFSNYTRMARNHASISSSTNTVNLTASANVNINSRSNISALASSKIDMDANGNIEITSTNSKVDIDAKENIEITSTEAKVDIDATTNVEITSQETVDIRGEHVHAQDVEDHGHEVSNLIHHHE